jgi:hypothetical protein
LLLENALNFIGLELEEKLNAHIGAMNGPSNDHLEENTDPNVQQKEDFLRAPWLKKKEVKSKNLRRINELNKSKHVHRSRDV